MCSYFMSPSTRSLISHNPEVKIKLLKPEISKFDGDFINFRGFWVNSAQLYIQMTVLTI